MAMNGRGTSTGLRDVLDTAIRGKEVASQFFQGLAQSIEDVELRRCLRRLAQEEWEHRKILLKHRRELFGRFEPGRAVAAVDVAVFGPLSVRRPIRVVEDLRLALRTALRIEEDVHRFFALASRNFEDDRAVKVFLRILSEEGLAQADHLRDALGLLDEVERVEGSVLRPGSPAVERGAAAALPL